MKTKLFFLIPLLLFSLGIRAQNVSIPDANFKAKLLSSSSGNTVAKNLSGNYFAIDSNGDGQIQQSEADQVSSIEIIGIDPPYYGVNPIINYQGILSFTNIKNIKINYWSTPTSFTISGLNSLENLDIYFQNSDPGNASVTNCPNLKNFSISGIPLQNFSNNPALKNVTIVFATTNAPQNILTAIEGLANLETLTLNGGMNASNQGPGLNLSNHQFLKKVSVTFLDLSFLNLSHCNLLDTINIDNSFSYPNSTPVYGGALNISYCPLFTTFNIDGNITSLTANNCPNLQSIGSTSKYLSGFSATNCPILNEIDLFSLNNSSPNPWFEVAGSPNLTDISIERYGSESFDATDAVNLEHLYLGSPSYYSWFSSYIFGPLHNLTISNNLKLKTLGISNHKLNQLNINGLPKLESISIGLNYYPSATYTPLPNFTTEFLQSAAIQDCPLLTQVSFDGQEGLKTVSIKNCPSLPQFVHSSILNNASVPPIWEMQSLDIEDCNALQSVDVSFNKLTHLKVKNASALQDVNVARNELTSYEFTNTNNLKTLNLRGNKFTGINISNLPSLISLNSSHNLLTTLVGSSSNLKDLNIYSNNLTDLDINNFPNLDSLVMGANKIVDVDFSGHSKIRKIYEPDFSYYYSSYFTTTNDPVFTKTFNVNNCINMEEVVLGSTSIEKVFAKNGVNELLILYTPNIQYICCDDSQIQAVENELSMNGLSNVNINTYCNFAPGGNYNTITGTVRFDENNNGCDINDEVFEHMKLKISNGTTTEGTFVKNNGKYDLYTQSGSFTVTTEPENPSLYTVTPNTFTTNFADNNNNISTQDICVTKNGNVKDLEVIIAPVTDARPGFNAVYKMIWRNKGNTTLSGNATLTFDASKMSFISSVLPSSVSGNQITFNFTGLKPYQNSASEITFNINPPTNPTNPVNIGDILTFTGVVNPISGDTNPDDNQFVYNQTVVGSFDPNDITCLEGNQIPVSMVGKYLHYIVNFENTGTAPATNIVVEMDVNPDDFDISSLQLQNTSHSTYTKVTGNKAEFIMKNINLEASAHGNIALKVKSKNSLVSGDSVINQANIYFDYNFPVETNEAVTNINAPGTTLQTNDVVKTESSVSVYPNPTKGDVNINADSKISSIEIYDEQGRIVQKHLGINANTAKVSIRSTISGMYLFKVITEKGGFTKKVIKN